MIFMKKFSINVFFVVVFLFFLPVVLAQTRAATLDFDPTTATTTVGQTFQIKVNINAGSEQVTGSDIYITYDASVLEAQSVSAGSFFPTVTNNITSGRVYIAAMVDDPASPKTGSGTLATVSFKGLKDGSVSLTFDCDRTTIVKNDVSASNIFQCSQSGSASVTVGAGGTNPTPTSTGTSTGGNLDQPTPTQLPQSGVFDDMVKWSRWGIILVMMAGLIRLLLL